MPVDPPDSGAVARKILFGTTLPLGGSTHGRPTWLPVNTGPSPPCLAAPLARGLIWERPQVISHHAQFYTTSHLEIQTVCFSQSKHGRLRTPWETTLFHAGITPPKGPSRSRTKAHTQKHTVQVTIAQVSRLNPKAAPHTLPSTRSLGPSSYLPDKYLPGVCSQIIKL